LAIEASSRARRPHQGPILLALFERKREKTIGGPSALF
jgi:hypothetical protein